MITEKHAILKDAWKLPGGLVDENEWLEEACVREVQEETGIKATVDGLLGFREMKKGLTYEIGDMYFVFMMRATGEQ